MLALSRLPEEPAIFGMWFPLFLPDKVPHTATAGAHSTPTRLAAGRHDQRPPRRVSCTLGLWQDPAVQVAVPRRSACNRPTQPAAYPARTCGGQAPRQGAP